jgi:glucose/arabinose dehydrogenase
MLGVFTSPRYATDHHVYLTYSEPGDGGSSLALARADLSISGDKASLDGLKVLWRQMPKGKGGQFGAQIAFSPDDGLFSRRRAPARGAGGSIKARQDPAPHARQPARAQQPERRERAPKRNADRSAERPRRRRGS